mmetsp:Transcript_45746/g.118237  ORF Transcript_45746/g.118237 Transcript_45746/m.118237 type:complete len:256 (-) Transcript_45746:46-813(-)
MQIFAFSMVLGICGCDISLSITIPSTRTESSNCPPTFPSTLIMSRFTSFLSKSATASTAFTDISANFLPHLFTTLEPSVVWHVLMRGSISSAVKSTVSAMLSSRSHATAQAFSKPSLIRAEWIPLSSNSSACSSSEPASTTTPVVPSPISSSCDFESCTNSLPTSFSTSMRSKMVAPSFVTVTSPSPEMRTLSIPLGPRLVRMMFATARAARMLAFCASKPLVLFTFSCSRKMMNGRPYSSKVTLIEKIYTGSLN